MIVSAFSGMVLAAGRSSRMGRDKALIEVDGAPLWRRQRDLLARAGAQEIFLSARPEQAWTQGAAGFTAIVYDAMPDCGPLVGLTAGLERATNPWLAVLAIDLPALTPEWFSDSRRGLNPGIGVIGRRGEFFEPLAAVYPLEFKWLAWEALARGEYALQPIAARAVAEGLLQVREIATEDEPQFENWNEPARG